MNKYVYTGGQYREFRGYVFKFGLPTTIQDRAAEEAISRMPDFAKYDEPKEQPTKVETSRQMEPVAADPDECPKCGKVVRQGGYMHRKFCKGKE